MVVVATPVPDFSQVAPIDVTTAARVKGLLTPAFGGDSTYDSLIDSMIKSISVQFEKFMNRHISRASRVEYFDVSSNQRVFYVRAYPISTYEDLRNDSLRVFGSGTVIAAEHYTVLGNDGLLNLYNYDPYPGNRTLRFEYTGGMATDTAGFITSFPDLAEAADMQIIFWLRRRTSLGSDSTSSPQGGSVSSSQADLLPEVKRRLEIYRRTGIR